MRDRPSLTPLSADYSCHFFDAPLGSSAGVVPVDARASFRAPTDDEAILRAEAKFRERSGRYRGFELWMGTRLVYRQCESPLERSLRGEGDDR